MTLAVVTIEERFALTAGKVAWGTYLDPERRKRESAMGHVRVVRSNPSYPPEPWQYGNYTARMNYTGFVDLNRNATALKNFFNEPNLDTSHMEQPLPADVEPVFISYNGTVMWGDSSGADAYRFLQGLWRGVLTFFEVRITLLPLMSNSL